MELQEYVFRFMSVRTGSLKKKAERAPQRLPVYERDRGTQLSKDVAQAWRNNATAAQILRIVATYQASPLHVKQLRDLSFDVERGLAWIVEHANDAIAGLDLATEFKTLYGKDIATLVTSPEYLASLDRIADTIVAEAIRRTWKEPTDPLSNARKLLALLRWASLGTTLPGEKLAAGLAAMSIEIPDYVALPRPTPDRPAQPSAGSGDKDVERKRAHLAALEHAHQELSRVVGDGHSLVLHEAPPVRAAIAARAAPMARRTSRAAQVRADALAIASPAQEFAGATVRLSAAAGGALSGMTRTVLSELSLDVTRRSPASVVGTIEEQMQTLSGQLAAVQRPNTVMLLGGVMIDSARLRDSIFAMPSGFGSNAFERCNFQAGVGDLLLVKQTLKAYELAEFAHVENVLAGESREREHRRLDVREETSTSESETETEKERNLQSTERNEMQSEAEKTVKSQFQLDAGLQVSGSYGPAVSFTASLNAGFSTSKIGRAHV